MDYQAAEKATIIRRDQVIARTGLSFSSIYRRVRAGQFPTPIHLGGNSVGWIETEVDAWVEERIQQSRRARPDAATTQDAVTA